MSSGRLYVDNLPYSTKHQDVYRKFERYGTLENVSMLTNGDGSFKGSALVEYKRISDAKYAKSKLDKTNFNGRTIVITFDSGPHSSRSDLDMRPPRDYTPMALVAASPMPHPPLPRAYPPRAVPAGYALQTGYPGEPPYPVQAVHPGYPVYPGDRRPDTPEIKPVRLSPEIEFYKKIIELYAEEVSSVVKDNAAIEKITIDKLGIAHLPSK